MLAAALLPLVLLGTVGLAIGAFVALFFALIGIEEVSGAAFAPAAWRFGRRRRPGVVP